MLPWDGHLRGVADHRTLASWRLQRGDCVLRTDRRVGRPSPSSARRRHPQCRARVARETREIPNHAGASVERRADRCGTVLRSEETAPGWCPFVWARLYGPSERCGSWGNFDWAERYGSTCSRGRHRSCGAVPLPSVASDADDFLGLPFAIPRSVQASRTAVRVHRVGHHESHHGPSCPGRWGRRRPAVARGPYPSRRGGSSLVGDPVFKTGRAV